MDIRELKSRCDAVDHWQVFEHFLGTAIRPKQLMLSPFRDERHPSFGIFRGRDGVVRYKDFAEEGGDIYAYIQRAHKVTFQEAVKQVALKLGIEAHHTPLPARTTPTIRVKPMARATTWFDGREWNRNDREYWEGKFNIPIALLQKNNVHGCKTFYLRNGQGRETTYHHSEEDPFYVYRIGTHHKLYRPKAPDKKLRFIGNTTSEDIFGSHPPVKLPVVITGGQKDALTAMAWFLCRAYSMNAENILPTNEQMMWMMKDATRVFVLYDGDATGIRYMNAMIRDYPFVKPIWIQEYSRHKDISAMAEHKETMAVMAINAVVNS